ncbi:tetratricopeptide repeat (TPR)-like superfamily protein isoform X2 [Tasmannia lanceolata]|uniref:tetratricopeptide repeat (TPR)-like superfamily protein isoform X2 n=1 Tax=Tasmannia lanceolata TaxID=3420 RepID=UPI0040640CD2
MASLRTDSPTCRRIVSAFLDFLKSVEAAPGVDLEGLEVVKECLEAVFKIDSSSVNDETQSGLLIDFFSSLDANTQHDLKSDMDLATTSMNAPNVSNDELFGQFCGALEGIHFFKTTPAGDDDHIQLAKAKHLFDEALMEVEKSGCKTSNCNSLAEALKSQGNKAMHSKLYSEAIELYTCAIALCQNNAVYYCNRAAAYTQIHKYIEAIADCNKSIEIDPSYNKAYSRLGMAYYAQGNYCDAINKGYLKALELDPTSDSIRENIRVAEQKLNKEIQQTERDQNTGPSHTQENSSRNRGAPSMQFNSALPVDLANILMNMASNAYQGQNTQDRPQNGDEEGSNEPEISINGNISVNFGEVPDELTGTWRSVMEMFSSAHGPQGGMHGGSAPN